MADAKNNLQAAKILHELWKPTSQAHKIILDGLEQALQEQREGIATALEIWASGVLEGLPKEKVLHIASLIRGGLQVQIEDEGEPKKEVSHA